MIDIMVMFCYSIKKSYAFTTYDVLLEDYEEYTKQPNQNERIQRVLYFCMTFELWYKLYGEP